MTEERKAEIQDVVEKVFQQYDITKTPYKFIKVICQNENISLLPVPNFSDDIEGWIQNIDGQYDILYNENKIEERQNFTLAHELGHYFLQHLKQGSLIDSEESLTKNNDEKECEANYFASNFLLPKKLVEKEFNSIITFSTRLKNVKIPLTISQNGYQFSNWTIIHTKLCKKFKVSKEFLCFRLDSLNLINNLLY